MPALVHDYLTRHAWCRAHLCRDGRAWPRPPSTRCYTPRRGPGGASPGPRVDHVVPAAPQPVDRPFRGSCRSIRPPWSGWPVERPRVIVSAAAPSRIAGQARRGRACTSLLPLAVPVRSGMKRTSFREVPRRRSAGAKRVLDRMRRWDWRPAARDALRGQLGDHQRRIQDFWGRDAAIVHPPVDVHRFRRPSPRTGSSR